MWFQHPDFKEVVREEWKDENKLRWEGFCFMHKWKNFKEQIKVWKKEDFGNITSKKAGILEDMKAFNEFTTEETISEEQKKNYQTLRTSLTWCLSMRTEVGERKNPS